MIEKMMIRSITYTINLNKLTDKKYLIFIKNNIEEMKKEFNNNNIKIRTIRFNIIAINDFNEKDIFNKLDMLSNFTNKLKLRWFNLSFNLLNKSNNHVDKVCNISLRILKNYENSFINFILAEDFINNYAVLESSKLIKNISRLSINGIDNFRFGVSLNIKPNTPFFPFSYSDTNDSFSLAIETTKKVIAIIDKKFNTDYNKLKEDIIVAIASDIKLFEKISENLSKKLNIIYNGQDISLSPYPDENISVIKILNLLGIDSFGSNGTQFLTSYLTSILKETISTNKIKAVGFNGVMYSLLEDKLMCKANDNKNFTIDSIILYSTVCGCGLDMVPLPGDIVEEEVASMILDVATTSIKLNKPLGVRVLPIPEKKRNDITNLKLDFLTNTKIPKVKNIYIDKSLFSLNKFFVKA
jgi:uncharacterized protein (UPF0210 family)